MAQSSSPKRANVSIAQSSSPKRVKRSLRSRSLYYVLVCLLCFGVAVLISDQFVLVGQFKQWSMPKSGCIGWRATSDCHPYGNREPEHDHSCHSRVNGASGYCECADRVTVARMFCGPHSFTCSERCREASARVPQVRRLPKPLTCGANETYMMHTLFSPSAVPDISDVDTYALGQHSNKLWDDLDELITTNAPPKVFLPGKRTSHEDWVLDGLHMKKSDVKAVRQSVEKYLAAAPEYQTNYFSGRGVVAVGGSLRYLITAWISIHMIRKTGCKLPVEWFFPVAEMPTRAMEQALLKLGVTCRRLDLRDLKQHGFVMKIAALMLSRFEEVLFLDADNLPVRDFTPFFDSKEYLETGAVFWQDFWDNTAARELSEILDIKPWSTAPKGSFESGQMLIDKRRHWRGLLLALYLNSYGALFYPLLDCYLGQGDKETFAYGILGVKGNITTIPHPLDAVGLLVSSCGWVWSKCSWKFRANTMVQPWIDGEPLFFHANLNKMTLSLPDEFEEYNRRWELFASSGHSVREWSMKTMGYDLEYEAYRQLRGLRCASWFDEYHTVRVRMGDPPSKPLEGLHTVPGGLDFVDFYRLGWKGNFMRFVHPGPLDLFLRFINRHFMRTLRPIIYLFSKPKPVPTENYPH